MKDKKKTKNINKYITIKRRINPDEELIHFIRHNCNKRRYIWNKFVEAYYDIKDPDKDRYFNKNDANNIRQQLIEKENSMINDPNTDDNIIDMYCSDIVLSVYKDVCTALEIMKTKWKEYKKKSDLKFKKYDPFRRSFRVRTRNEISPLTNLPKGKVHFKNNNKFEFRASNKQIKNKYIINLMEPISDFYDDKYNTFVVYDKLNSNKIKFTFNHEDIKNISFMEELGKFYVLFQVKPYYYHEEKDKINRKKVAGIDLGIRNPVTIYDNTSDKKINKKKKDVIIMRIEGRDMARMQYYERKTRHIQSVMKHKYDINKERHLADPDYPLYSKRYRKMQRRFRVYWKKITDIRRNWRLKIADYITNHYKTIIVDEFRTPDNSKDEKLSNRQKRLFNHQNRQHAMTYFMEALRFMCVKNDCNYIEAPENTTRTCSKCNHINPPLPINKEYLICEKCGKKIQRDYNAAKNCYKFYVNSISN